MSHILKWNWWNLNLSRIDDEWPRSLKGVRFICVFVLRTFELMSNHLINLNGVKIHFLPGYRNFVSCSSQTVHYRRIRHECFQMYLLNCKSGGNKLFVVPWRNFQSGSFLSDDVDGIEERNSEEQKLIWNVKIHFEETDSRVGNEKYNCALTSGFAHQFVIVLTNFTVTSSSDQIN